MAYADQLANASSATAFSVPSNPLVVADNLFAEFKELWQCQIVLGAIGAPTTDFESGGSESILNVINRRE